tara:strand:+ start:607 stop:1059 length:453 start_codon:yes stop_codon:yes gene_type:complete
MPKDKLVNTTKHGEGSSRVKPIKKIGKNAEGKTIQTMLVKNPDKSTITNRYKDGDLVDSNYNPKKMRKKKTKKLKSTRIPRKLKKVATPSYTAPEVTLDKKTQAIADARDRKKNSKKKLKIKIPKIKINKGKKVRKTRNLVTGKINKTQG